MLIAEQALLTHNHILDFEMWTDRGVPTRDSSFQVFRCCSLAPKFNLHCSLAWTNKNHSTGENTAGLNTPSVWVAWVGLNSLLQQCCFCALQWAAWLQRWRERCLTIPLESNYFWHFSKTKKCFPHRRVTSCHSSSHPQKDGSFSLLKTNCAINHTEVCVTAVFFSMLEKIIQTFYLKHPPLQSTYSYYVTCFFHASNFCPKKFYFFSNREISSIQVTNFYSSALFMLSDGKIGGKSWM